MDRRLTLIAGSGALVPEVVAAAHRAGWQLQILSLSGTAAIAGSVAVSLADPADILARIAAFASTHLAFAGAVDFSDADRAAIAAAAGRPSQKSAGDAGFSKLGMDIARSLGVVLVRPQDIVPDLLAPAGHIAGPLLDSIATETAGHGLRVAREVGQLDLGQAVVLSGRRIVAVEDIGGTDLLLDRVKQFVARGLVGVAGATLLLAKASKPGQPDYVDLPAIGPRTVAGARAAGIGLIAIEAGRTLLIERMALIEAADSNSVSVFGFAADA